MGPFLDITKDCKIIQAAGAATAGTGNVDTVVIDMQGYNAISFLASLATSKSGSALALRALEGASSDSLNVYTTDQFAAKYTSTGLGTDHLLAGSVIRPKDRYVQGRLTRATQNASVNGIIAVLHNAIKSPTTSHDATVKGTDSAVTPTT